MRFKLKLVHCRFLQVQFELNQLADLSQSSRAGLELSESLGVPAG